MQIDILKLRSFAEKVLVRLLEEVETFYIIFLIYSNRNDDELLRY